MKKHVLTFIMNVVVVDVGWDWVNQKLYWTDPCANDIEVYDTTTMYRRILYNTADGIRDPSGMVVDPTTGYDSVIEGHGALVFLFFFYFTGGSIGLIEEQTQ